MNVFDVVRETVCLEEEVHCLMWNCGPKRTQPQVNNRLHVDMTLRGKSKIWKHALKVTRTVFLTFVLVNG